MQEPTPAQREIMNSLNEAEKKRVWGQIVIELQDGKPVKLTTTKTEKLSN